MTIYEINKQLMAKEQPLDDEKLLEKKELIAKYAKDHGYYMLLCNDLRYYTIFDKHCECQIDNKPEIANEVIECLRELGEIYAIEPDEENGTIEIWIRQEEEMYAVYFFDYTGGVIQCV